LKSAALEAKKVASSEGTLLKRSAPKAKRSFSANPKLATRNSQREARLMKPFELHHAPLEVVILIEVGAGTGKTYNIEGLFVRLNL